MAQERIGRYEILQRLGSGVFGTVYRARDTGLDRVVAVKVLLPHHAEDQTVVERFLREARFAARLDHPNVVRIYDVGQEDDSYYIVMEFVPTSLKEVLGREGRLAPERALDIARQIALGLAEAHRHEIVHRDVKPANVLIAEDATVKVTDFGIARAADLARLSGTREAIGTPAYMSPEQVRGGEIDPRSDVYSLGCVLYELVAGTVPYSGSVFEVMRQHQEAPVPRLSDADSTVPRPVQEIVQRALAKSPDERFQSAEEMADAIRAAVPGITQAPPPPADPTERVEEVRPAPPPPPEPTPRPPAAGPPPGEPLRPRPAGRRRWRVPAVMYVLAILVIVGAIAGVIALVSAMGGDKDPTATPAPALLAATATRAPVLSVPTSTPARTEVPAAAATPTPTAIPTLVPTQVGTATPEVEATAPTPTPEPAAVANAVGLPGPASAGKLAFTSDRDGNDEIYVMKADGTNQARLTDDPAEDLMPAWSPGGSRIAFYSDRNGNSEIYVMNADGTGQTRLTDNPGDDSWPAWSPDGSRIAFHSLRDGNWDIYVMNADGTGQTRLTHDLALDRMPDWSPDGTRIAFVSDRDGHSEIHVMNADGTGQTRFTDNSAFDLAPAWSPDGGRIAFDSYKDGNFAIYVINADGSSLTRLTDNSAVDFLPAWSPDGSKIAFESNRDGNREIYVMNADGSGQTRLTDNPADDFAPAWSPAPAAVTTAPTPTATPVPPTPTLLVVPSPTPVAPTPSGTPVVSRVIVSGAELVVLSASFPGFEIPAQAGMRIKFQGIQQLRSISATPVPPEVQTMASAVPPRIVYREIGALWSTRTEAPPPNLVALAGAVQ